MRARFGRLLALCLLTLLWTSRAQAYSLVLTPVTVVLEVPAGGTGSFTLRMTNEGEPDPNAPGMPLITYTWDYWHGPNGRYMAPPGTTPRSVAGWLEIVPRQTVLPLGDTVEFLGTISVPPDAEGGYYGMVFAQTDYGSDGLATASMAQARLGARVLLRISGTGVERLEVTAAEFKRAGATHPGSIAITVHNAGTVHVAAEFRGVLRTPGGEVLRSLASGPATWILPGETTQIDVALSDVLEAGAYELAGAVMWGDSAVPLVMPLIVNADARLP